jgi:GTP-binding protein
VTGEKAFARLQATFLASAPALATCPPADAPEVAFAGRSNAGKSSTLNRLTGNRATARVSRTPGRTRLLNFFDVAPRGRIVDLPGYGYANAPRAEQMRWQQAVNEYLSGRESLVGVVLVTDIRHPDQPLDLELIAWAVASGVEIQILLNKADKLKSGARRQALAACRARHAGTHGVGAQTFSSSSGEGVEE